MFEDGTFTDALRGLMGDGHHESNKTTTTADFELEPSDLGLADGVEQNEFIHGMQLNVIGRTTE